MQQELLGLTIKDTFNYWSDRSEIYRLDYSNDDFTKLSTTLLQPGYGGAGLSSKIHAYKL